MINKTQIQNDIISALPDVVHGILLIAMRVGKTRIAIKQIKKENCKSILWVTPSPKLRDFDIPREFIRWNEKDLLDRTKLTTYAGLKKIKGKHFNKIIIDEGQDLTPENVKPLLDGTITYDSIIMLTGELPKHKEKLEIYEKLNLKVIKEITLDEAITMGLVEDYKINVIYTRLSDVKDLEIKTKTITFTTSEKENYGYLNSRVEKPEVMNGVQYDIEKETITLNKKEFKLKQFVPKFDCDKSYLIVLSGYSFGYIAFKDSTIFGSYNTTHGSYRIDGNNLIPKSSQFDILNRMKCVYNLNSKLSIAKQLISRLKGRTISFCGSIEHAIKISEYNYHSKTDKTWLNKFTNKEVNLLSCVNSGGTGFTFNDVNNIVLVQINSNKKGSVSQKIARGLLLDGSGTTNIYIICAKDTVDEKWLSEVLKDIDVKRISYYNNLNELNEER